MNNVPFPLVQIGARGITSTAGAIVVVVVMMIGGAAYYFYGNSVGGRTNFLSTMNTTSARTTLSTFAPFGTSTTVPSQATCSVAQLINPVPGSTLPVGPVTFQWCNANADYFLTLESIPGAHDIFYAFAGGAGPGAGVTSVTLGPDCAPRVPTGCIPAKGETIYLTLWTMKKGVVVPPSPFNYSFTAPSGA